VARSLLRPRVLRATADLTRPATLWAHLAVIARLALAALTNSFAFRRCRWAQLSWILDRSPTNHRTIPTDPGVEQAWLTRRSEAASTLMREWSIRFQLTRSLPKRALTYRGG